MPHSNHINKQMGYLVEKQVLSGFAYHHMNVVYSWEQKENKLSVEDAKKSAIEYATKIEKGKYRVRDIYSGKVLFEVSS